MTGNSIKPSAPKAHLVLGFLGVGKTTAVRYLLSQKPETERWAILVNEFGEIGVDAALLADTGVKVEQIDGGCMCCTAGPVTTVILQALLEQERPDRLIIETSGLSHPIDTLELLKKQEREGSIQLHANLTLIDSRYAIREYYQNHPLFQDQLSIADCVVLNKSDLSSARELTTAEEWVRSRVSPSVECYRTQSGMIDIQWLDAAKEVARVNDSAERAERSKPLPVLDLSGGKPLPPEPGNWLMSSRENAGFYTIGWRISPVEVWSKSKLVNALSGFSFLRVKGVVHTDKGWITINNVKDHLETHPCDPRDQSILECIDDYPIDKDRLLSSLKASMT